MSAYKYPSLAFVWHLLSGHCHRHIIAHNLRSPASPLAARRVFASLFSLVQLMLQFVCETVLCASVALGAVVAVVVRCCRRRVMFLFARLRLQLKMRVIVEDVAHVDEQRQTHALALRSRRHCIHARYSRTHTMKYELSAPPSWEPAHLSRRRVHTHTQKTTTAWMSCTENEPKNRCINEWSLLKIRAHAFRQKTH